MPLSSVEGFLKSKSLEEWRAFKEGVLKIQSAVVDRLNLLIKAAGKKGY